MHFGGVPLRGLRLLLRNPTNHFPLSTRLSSLLFPALMPTEQAIETEGIIVAVLAGTMFRVELGNKHRVLAHISGKMRKRFIRLTLGDKVKLEMSPYDLDKARITYRLR
jgi:translation initiation factor IF-1